MPKEVGHDGEGGGGSEMGGSPARVDGLETVCRRLLLLDHNGSDTMERKQCHSLLDWLILRCNHQSSMAIHEFSWDSGDSCSFGRGGSRNYECCPLSRIMSPMLILLRTGEKGHRL